MKTSKPSILKVYILPILVLITIILLVPLVLMPQLNSIRDKNLEVKNASSRLEKLNGKIQALNNIDETDESLKLIEMSRIIPSDKEVAELVVGVRNIAAQSNLSVKEFKFSPGKVATGAATPSASKKAKAAAANEAKEVEKNKNTLSLTLGGKLENVNLFLSRIENAKRLLGIKSISTTKVRKGDYEISFEIAAPFKGVDIKGDVVASPLPPLTNDLLDIYDFVVAFQNYTNVTIPLGPTGVSDPFK